MSLGLIAGKQHRELAEALVSDVRVRRPEVLLWRDVDLGPAVEQALFAEMMWGRLVPGPERSGATSGNRASRVRLASASLAPRLRPERPPPGHPAALLLVPVHERILAPINGVLEERGLHGITAIHDGWALSGTRATAAGPRVRLVDFMTARDWAAMSVSLGSALAGFPAATMGWTSILGPSARHARLIGGQGLARAIAHASRLDAMLRFLRPPLLITFDESGLWARLLPVVARRLGVPSLDLPHADTISPAAVTGAAYTKMAVFGGRAAARLTEAGVASDRIVETGAPRFDDLVRIVGLDPKSEAIGRRVVLASQPLTGEMTAKVKAEVFRSALAVAQEQAPAEVVVVPHPLETDNVIREELLGSELPTNVSVRFAERGDLYKELPGALVLVTEWSSCVLEAAVAGVPAVVAKFGEEPDLLSFVADGLAVRASSVQAASEIGRRLADQATRAALVAQARQAVTMYIGPLDGRASERTADLVVQLAGLA